MGRRTLGRAFLAAALAGCGTAPPPPAGNLLGPGALAVSSGAIALASTERSELRVLRVPTEPTDQTCTIDSDCRAGSFCPRGDVCVRLPTFVRAPNPLYALSIPVTSRPVAVAGDARDKDGNLAALPYVFALSVETQSVVAIDAQTADERAAKADADPMDDFVVRGMIRLPGQPLALAAAAAATDRPIAVYVASQEGATATIRRLEFGPVPAALDASRVTTRLVATLPGRFPQAIDVRPTADGDRIAVALRSPDDGTSGVALVDARAATATVATVDTAGPVRQAVFDASGRWLFAILDPDGCTLAPSCRGLLAFDLSQPVPVSPAGPLAIPGAPTAMALAENLDIRVAGTNAKQHADAVAVVASTDGQVYVVDAGERRLAVVHVRPDGTDDSSLADPATGRPLGPTQVAFAEGGGREETIRVTFEGAIVPWADRSVSVDGSANPPALTEPTLDIATAGIFPGDVVTVEQGAGGGCPAEGRVDAILGNPGRIAVAGLDGACLTETITYSVRPSGAYAVTSHATTADGTPVTTHLGRIAAPGTFAVKDPNPTALRAFQIGRGDPRRGAGYRFVVGRGFKSFGAPLGVPGLASFPLPAAGVTFEPASSRFFAVLPAAHAIAQIVPERLSVGGGEIKDGVNYFK